MRSFSRSIASATGLLVLAAGLVSLPATAMAATDPAGNGTSLPVESGSEQVHHGYESAPGVPVDGPPAGLALQTEAGGTAAAALTVKVVVATLVDNKATVPMAQAEAAVAASSNYWKAMSGGRISMTVTERATLASKTARSTDSYYDMINKITTELKWTYGTNKALVVFVPTATLSGGALGAGYSSTGNSGRVLMPQISGFTNSVIAHEFGHVLGSMHADALQCGSGVSDVGTTSTGQFTDASCYIREYGDSTDLMGLSSYNMPVIGSPFWDAKGLGAATDIRDLGVASGVKSYTLKPWGDTKLAYRAVKFTDPVSREVYYLELRQPAGYDAYLASGPAGNRGVKVVQRGGATPWSSLALMPSTVPFSGYYGTNHTWPAGRTFITHAGTRVTINTVTATSATVTIDADLALRTKIQFSAGDFNGDGRPDMVSRESNGTLLLYPGQPGNKIGTAVKIGTGWNIFNTVLGNRDFSGDGLADILARSSDGTLWLYPGNGTGGFQPRKQIGSGWQIFRRIVAAGDFDGDGKPDLLGVHTDGSLRLYPGNGMGGFLTARQIGSGWQGFTTVTSASGFTSGAAGLLARASNGTVYLYPGNGIGGFGARKVLSTGWNSASDIVGGHDFTGDNRGDVLAAGTAGSLAVHAGTGTGSLAGRLAIGTGWGGLSQVWEAGDFDGDGKPDILGRTKAGQLRLYPGNGSGGFRPSRQIGSGWQAFTQVLSAGNFNGAGGLDLVARTPDGSLMLYPSDGRGNFLAPKKIGSGWNMFTRMIAPGDFSGDGRTDIMGQTADGKLWLYPGNGTGGFLARKQIGSGWGSFSQVLSGDDFNGDGRPDLMARTTDGKLLLYPGSGASGFLDSSQIGSGWSGMSALASVGTFAGAGNPNVVAVSSDGTLWLYAGSGKGTFQNVVLNPR
ncbi:FG-GAP-like repeat-containing protein [uncultured Arthrobacter sp.]|uniref:FG-GAP-like repeat-containing protein n=1 Tax=uncultured Arthrobacter sp. TaxID=114050 RepID=UPI0028D44E9D|nr:FG-GAP-like repeat-containing protein [uncultured Arthrobacter sp.]